MKKQYGVALITILVMVALATILAATIAKRQAHTSDMTGYLMRQNQSLMYAKSAEAFFIELLKDDAETAGDIDHLLESWAQPMPAFPVEDGYVAGALLDESGKFNLNSLLKADGTVNEPAKAWFERLLQRVDLAPQLVEAVIDWQDADDILIGSMGAESQFYGAKRPAYLQPNQAFHSIEELKSVRGFEGQNFQRIAPYVSAGGIDQTLNINTAAALVLSSLDEQLDINRIQQQLDERQANAQYFSEVEDLWRLDGFDQITADKKAALKSQLGIKSNLFKARIEVVLNERKRQFTTDLVRDGKQIQIQARSLTPF